MPQIAKAKKRMRQDARKRLLNRSVKSHLKRRIKKFEEAVNSESTEEARKQALLLQRSFDKAVTHGVIHKNKASRKVASSALKLNNLLRSTGG